MMDHSLTCLTCPHVRTALVSARFIVNLGGGHWAAACSQPCLDQCADDAFETIRLAHLARLKGLPAQLPLSGLPAGMALRRDGAGWRIGYFDTAFQPEGGEFAAVPPDHPARGLSAADPVLVLTENGRPAEIRQRNGTRCIPVWGSRENAEAFADHRPPGAALSEMSLGAAVRAAAERDIVFLAWDYCAAPFEMALLADPDQTSGAGGSSSSP